MHMLPFVSLAALLLAACSAPIAPGMHTEADGTALAADVTSPAPQAPAPQSRAIPPRFHGRWAATAERCGLPGDESALTIRHDDVAFHESSGPPLGAMDDGDKLEVLLHLTGEGETREAWYTFHLEDGGNALVDAATNFRRVRCRDAMSVP